MRTDVGAPGSESSAFQPGTLAHRFVFESFGVRVTIESNRDDVLAKARNVVHTALVGQLTFFESEDRVGGHHFGLTMEPDGTLLLFEEGRRSTHSTSEFRVFKYFDSMVRLTVAENAVDRVFVHSGVVGWKGRAVIFPARSFKGKSRIVAELARRGAEYYSDEYAIIGPDGLVHPFPREITLRGIEHEYWETPVDVRELGGKVGTEPIPVGAVILAEFEPDGIWKPEILTLGNGVMEVMMHAIPLRSNTKFSLKVLNNAFSRAIIAKSSRGEARSAAREILAYLDEKLN